MNEESWEDFGSHWHTSCVCELIRLFRERRSEHPIALGGETIAGLSPERSAELVRFFEARLAEQDAEARLREREEMIERLALDSARWASAARLLLRLATATVRLKDAEAVLLVDELCELAGVEPRSRPAHRLKSGFRI